MRHRFETSLPRFIWIGLFAISTACAAIFVTAFAIAPARAAEPEKEIVILALGDSLTAGFQLPPDKAFPAQLQAALRAKGHAVRVLNAGVSGDTAADGAARLDWSMSEPADAAIVELGANDMLRGLDPKQTEASLDAILKALSDKRVDLLIAGMEPLRNWGEDYAAQFRAMWPRLAKDYNAILYPFFLKGVATVAALNQPDGLHPTGDGVAVIVRNILPDVEKLIARVKERRSGTH
ncbi:lipolytic protein G-D-S-L family [Rhodomicrobium vannielii ATCC 17100]|uniref:Lipolytic protein G-D-S-L family n=1 Tax=Rhodomicrobium vannielii (strain ATCC 17100 / DSM 162 / LMG 4299 / NCIMB 10020 / ATH 3.1.1) TaxID=648757 RepID=E3I3X0_RHOVT|nr:arylesterase [Rhodomicrobium vannielii]ADP71533.1 lipolytic protein G-D-S-L family [Rhodomicrobium vannielii ATCC 17100]